MKKIVGLDRETTWVWIHCGMTTVMIAIWLCDAVTSYGILSQNFCQNNDKKGPNGPLQLLVK